MNKRYIQITIAGALLPVVCGIVLSIGHSPDVLEENPESEPRKRVSIPISGMPTWDLLESDAFEIS
jgi:hypothetical protein